MKLSIVIIACLLLISKNVFAVDPTLDWKTIENNHLYVHYSDGNKAMAEKALAIAKAAHIRLTDELNWYPIKKTHLILSDETDEPNGFATPIFFNRTVIFLAPPTSVDTLEDFDDWLTTVIVHEYTHIVHLDKSSGSPEYLRNIFGRMFLLFPNVYQPAWVTEGLATYKETDIERGIGRGQSTMFASMMREEVANGLQPISHVNLPVATWPAGTTRYLYGVYFMSFIAERYGEDKLQEWVEEYSDNLIPFFINTNADQTLGKQLTPLWEEFQLWLVEKFQPQIDAIKAEGIIKGEKISTDAYRTDSVSAVSTADGDEVFYVRNGGYKRASLMHIDSKGQQHELLGLNSGAELDAHPKAGLLLTQDEYCNNYTIYKDIYLYDKALGELKRLTECGRYLSASWHLEGKSIIAAHHDAGKFELHLLDDSAKLQEVLWQASNGEILGQIDVSPDGKHVVAAKWRRGNGWNLELFNIEKRSWEKLTRNVSIVANPRFSADGNIMFSLEANGVYNLHCYDVVSKRVTRLSNTIGGAFQSSQASSDGDIYYVGYSAEGYAVYQLALDRAVHDEPELDAWDDGSLAEERLAEEGQGLSLPVSEPVSSVPVTTAPATAEYLKTLNYQMSSHEESDYFALSNMYPRWWFPTFVYSDQRSEFGVTTTGGDALAIHNYTVTASYDTSLNLPAGEIAYAYADRLFLSAVNLNEIRLNTNGEINRISKRNVINAGFSFPKREILQQSALLFSAIFDTTSDEKLAAGAVPFESFEDHLLGVAWLYDTSDLNPLSISLNDGLRLRLVAEDSDILQSDFTGQVYTFDWRQYIRTGKESVVALRFLQGWGTDQPREFELGGEGRSQDALNALLGIISSDSVFNNRDYALRGYPEGLPQLRGRRVQLLTGEWRFPLQRIEQGVMTPPIGIMQWFGTVFAETGSAYEDSPETYYSSAGLELTADMNVFYGLMLRIRVGFAHGFDEEIGEDRAYLKIGSSF